MNTKRIVILSAIFALMLPLGALAMSHEQGEKSEKMEHGKMGGMNHENMMMQGDMIMLGDETEDGVKASVHLKDVGAAMAKMGMKENFHFMIMFVDTQSGKPIEDGTVAVKITDPSGKEAGAPVELMGMQGHFGADIALTEKGEYHFKVGTKLADGKKRQYQFHYTVK